MYHNAYRAFLQRIYYNGIVISIPTFEDFLLYLDGSIFSSTFRATSSLNLFIDTRSIIGELDTDIENVSTEDICYRLD